MILPVSIEVLRKLMLDKIRTGFIIIESDLPVGVGLAPGLHHGPDAIRHLVGLESLVNDLGNELWIITALADWMFV